MNEVEDAALEESARKVIKAIAAQMQESEEDALRVVMGAYSKGVEDGKATVGSVAVLFEADKFAGEGSSEVWGYASSEHCETWDGNCVTREEAIVAGRDQFGNDAFWIMCGTRPDPAKYVPDVETILTQMGENAGDEGGEAAEDYPDVDTKGRTALYTLLKAWARIFARPNFWVATGVAELVKAL